jgi:hypothetical protein
MRADRSFSRSSAKPRRILPPPRREVLEQLHVRDEDEPPAYLSGFPFRVRFGTHLQPALYVDEGAGVQVVDDQVGEPAAALVPGHGAVSSGVLVDRRGTVGRDGQDEPGRRLSCWREGELRIRHQATQELESGPVHAATS